MRDITPTCIRNCAIFCLMSGFFTGACTAQQGVSPDAHSFVHSSIAGLVVDASGAVLPGVTVEAASPALPGKPRSVLTDGEGRYEIEDLPPGRYSVTFRAAGFKTVKHDDVTLAAEFAATLDAEMNLSALDQTVTVTARDREEDIQKVPQSIAAFSGDALQVQSIHRMSDLGQVTPNFLYGQKIQSGSSAGQIYIRGIGQQDTNVQFSSGVGIYVDGVYLGRAQANDLEMADVERVEVLYGPQGTLFGKNSDGGAVNVTTIMPELGAKSVSGPVDVQTGNRGRLDLNGVWNIPLVKDKAAMLITVAGWRQDGYSKRILDGQTAGDQDRAAARVKLLVKPSDQWQALLGLDGTIFNERSAAYRLVEVRATSSIPMLYATSTPYRYDDRWVTKSDFQYNGTGPNKDAGYVWGSSLTLNRTRPWGVLKSITAFRKLSVDSEFDPDGSPLTVLDVFNYVNQHQFSQEFQATGTSFHSRLHWVAGLYYFRESAQDIQPVNIALEIFHGSANVSYNNYVVNQNPAMYGQATFALTNKLNLTAGARLSEDLVRAQRIQVGYPIPSVQQPLVTRAANWTSFLPRIGLDYHWTPKVMTYASAAEGEKNGGYNGRASSVAEFTRFEPEKVWAYEGGLRSEWLSQRLRVNATGFYSDYRGFQIQINRSTIDPVSGLPVAFSYVGNMPKATIKGGEFSVTAVPLANLLVSAGLGLTDGKYVSINTGAPVTTSSQFVNAPKCTSTLGAEYSKILPRGGEVTGRVDYVRKSRIEYDYGDSPLVAQAPYGLLNAKVAWQKPESHVSFFLFGTNLANAYYAVGGLDDGPGGSLGEVIKLMGSPREWGLGGQFRF
jgi:iron complex outermembrane receptor protein